MVLTKPNITFLSTKQYVYMYDGNTGKILRINPLIRLIIEEYWGIPDREIYTRLEGKYLSGEIGQALARIEQAKAWGLLTTHQKHLFLDEMFAEIEYEMENMLNGVCLGVTQQCNLRCDYCAYSGVYDNGGRVHSGAAMSFATAKKAIDIAIRRSALCDRFFVAFYGGEPLLRLDLIQQCIQYVQSEYPGRVLDFNITTNGTLLSEEVIDYLAGHQVRLYISIDGPEEYHDEYRVYGGTRKGTFGDIRRNLLLMKAKYPDYYERMVHFGITLSPYRSLDVVEDFIASDEIFPPQAYVRISNVYEGESLPLYAAKRGQEKDVVRERKFLGLRYVHSKIHRNQEFLTRTRMAQGFFEPVDIIGKRTAGFAAERILPGGCCIPGQKLFVTTNGVFTVCEKCNETAPDFNLGNVDEGLDLKKSRALVEKFYRLTEEECLHCWAYRSCTICPAQIEISGGMSREAKLKKCETIREMVHQEYLYYLMILEKNHEAFFAG